MAMVRQQTDGEIINRSTPEGNGAVSDMVENCSSRPSSRASSGSKRSTPPVMPALQYSKDDLVKYSTTPLSKNWPSCLDPAYNNSTGKWDPERWFMNHRSDRLSSLDESRPKRDRQDDCLVSNKRKSSDPKERLKEEKDDIVLGPQRRSFGTGCHVTQQQSTLARRPGSPLDRDENFREPSRRIGSGRIMTRDRDQRDWDRDREYGYGRTDRDRRDRFDPDDDKDLRRFTSNNRYNQRDRRTRTGSTHGRIDEMEPEWFSGGPTSQSETIELVGFEDPHDGDGKKAAKKKRKQNSRRSSLKEDAEKMDIALPSEEKSFQKKVTSEPIKDEVKKEASEAKEPDESKNTNDSTTQEKKFEVDELFKLDWIAGLPLSEAPVEAPASQIGCSRFSQWFRKESPIPHEHESGNNSRRSSLHDELIANVLNSIVEPQIMIPSPTQPDNYFAPISPAMHRSPGHPQGFSNSNNNIMQMLQQSAKTSVMNGALPQESVKTVRELEADLKRIVLGGDKPKEEKSAFDKLLQHMSDTNAQAAPLSMGPLDKSKALQEQDLLQDMLSRPPSSQPAGSSAPFQMFEQKKPVFQIPPGMPPPNFNQTNQAAQNNAFAQLMQQKQHEQNSQPQQHILQNQMPPPTQSPNPANPQGSFSVDMLAKLLNPAGSQPPLSPSALQANFGPMRNDSQQVINSVLQAQRQRELLTTLLKQQQQQQQPFPLNMAQPNMLPQQPVQPRRCPSAKDGQLQQTLNLPTLGISPRQSPLPNEAVGNAMPSQGRIPSPLIFGQQPPALSHAPAPIHPAALVQAMSQNSVSPNTLQVQNPVVLQRVPSPQELAVHTQSILQNALIKRKLEEQKENFRKRQEAQRSTSPASINKNGASPSNLKEPSPTIAFTPTSVMRKIQSEKTEVKEQKVNPLQQNGGKFPTDQSRIPDITNLNAPKPNSTMANIPTSMESNFGAQFHNPPNSNIPTQAQRTLHGQAPVNHPRSVFGITAAGMPMGMQGQGRPIVKVGMSQPMNANDMGRAGMPNKNVQHNKMMMPNSNNQTRTQNMSNLPQQLQMTAALASINRPPLNHPNMMRPMTPATGPPANNMNYPPLIRNAGQNPIRAPNVPLNQLNHLNQLAALQMQRGPLDSRQLQVLAQQTQRLHPAALQQLLMNSQNSAAAAHAQVVSGFPGARVDSKHLLPGHQPGGQSRQSPVNLTKWFGNDVLQQKMPDMPPLPVQKALSLEEVERQQQVHN